MKKQLSILERYRNGGSVVIATIGRPKGSTKPPDQRKGHDWHGRLTDAQYAELIALGGADWLRHTLDKSIRKRK